MVIRQAMIAALMMSSSVVTAAPSVSGNTISWPDDGWYQVQDELTYGEICGGTRSCTVQPGSYVVINHSTGERFEGIEVEESSGTGPITVSGSVISWPDDGWYQVQDEASYTEVCAGGRSCSVSAGSYVVINHTTGERFAGITVEGQTGSTISVSDNIISWPDDGWYQVQDQLSYAQQCAGGRSCAVAPGTYIVINHSTGRRWEDVVVGGTDLPANIQASLTLVADKTFRISWQASAGAQFYRLLENPDGVSGFSPVGDEIQSSVNSVDHRVALYARINARYIVQACNTNGCVDSEEIAVSGSLVQAIGYFKASNTGSFDFFGSAIALSADGQTLAVSAPQEDSGATGINGNQFNYSAYRSGAVYVFSRNDGVWQQQAYVKASNTNDWDTFGRALSLSADGNTLAVGAYFEDSAATGINGDQDDNSAELSGAVYVYVRSSDSWQQQAYVKASNAEASDLFGTALALSADGDTLAVGASAEESSARGINGDQADNVGKDSGAVYVFVRDNGSWQQQAWLKASNADNGDAFGQALAISADGNTLAVRAISEDSASSGINADQDDNSLSGSGAVYVFARRDDDWQQEAYVKAAYPGVGDSFGLSVSLDADGNTLAVGVPFEDSAATGIDGDQGDNSLPSSGAVLVFVRSSGSWQQQAYVKAGNPDRSDYFGGSVSLSGDGHTLAVGSSDEDSAATGLNGDEQDNSSSGSGAAYVFMRKAGIWQQQAYIKASTTGGGQFGSALVLSADGETLAVGEGWDSSSASGINGDPNDNGAIFSGAVYLY